MRKLVLIAAVSATVLSGCGTTETPTEADATASGRPVSVTDARGKEISLDAPATKVVGLEWGLVENLITLGVMPVGVADVDGYSTWVSAEKLDDSVKDVGTRGEPSVDAIAALDPDLVIATTDEAASTVEQIEKYVPVLVIRAAAAENPIKQMTDNVTLIGQAVGRTDEADQVLADFDTAIADGKKAIADAGHADTPFTMADSWLEGSTVSIRIFSEGSLLGAVGNALGLKNVSTGEPDPDYGLAQTDVEGLTRLGDVVFLYIASDEDGGDAFEQGLSGNAVWESLPFVQKGAVHRLSDGIWMFGGPKSTEQFIDATVAALTS